MRRKGGILERKNLCSRFTHTLRRNYHKTSWLWTSWAPRIYQTNVQEVKEILNSWWRGNKLQYLIKWRGQPLEERTWKNREEVIKGVPVELRMSSKKSGEKLVANMQHSLLLSQLFILHKTIRYRIIRSHMHCAGLHDIQIPTAPRSCKEFHQKHPNAPKILTIWLPAKTYADIARTWS